MLITELRPTIWGLLFKKNHFFISRESVLINLIGEIFKIAEGMLPIMYNMTWWGETGSKKIQVQEKKLRGKKVKEKGEWTEWKERGNFPNGHILYCKKKD